MEEARTIAPAVAIHTTSSANQAWEWSQEAKFDAFFLDIKTADESGIELAKKLRARKEYRFTPIIFITAMPYYEMEAFRLIHCYDFITKPIHREALQRTFRTILLEYFEQQEDDAEPHRIPLEYKHFTQWINSDSITHIEYVQRKIMIYTEQEVISYVRVSLQSFAEKLPPHFVQVHQSIYVNMKKVIEIDKANHTLTIAQRAQHIPIGKTFRKGMTQFTS